MIFPIFTTKFSLVPLNIFREFKLPFSTKLDMSKYSKLLQPLNIEAISVTDEVSNENISNIINSSQS